jgi:hypothetical protein
MHQIGIVLASKDVTGTAHIGGELINLIKAAVDDSAAESGIPQIANDEIIGFALRELMKLQVDTPHPIPITLQPFYQVAPDEAAGATDQCTLRHNASPRGSLLNCWAGVAVAPAENRRFHGLRMSTLSALQHRSSLHDS